MSSVECVDVPPIAFLSTVAVFIKVCGLIQLTQYDVSIGQSQREGAFTTKSRTQLRPRSGRERRVVRENPPASPDKNRIQLFCPARHRHARQSQISRRLSPTLFVSLPRRHRSHCRLATRYHIA